MYQTENSETLEVTWFKSSHFTDKGSRAQLFSDLLKVVQGFGDRIEFHLPDFKSDAYFSKTIMSYRLGISYWISHQPCDLG